MNRKLRFGATAGTCVGCCLLGAGILLSANTQAQERVAAQENATVVEVRLEDLALPEGFNVVRTEANRSDASCEGTTTAAVEEPRPHGRYDGEPQFETVSLVDRWSALHGKQDKVEFVIENPVAEQVAEIQAEFIERINRASASGDRRAADEAAQAYRAALDEVAHGIDTPAPPNVHGYDGPPPELRSPLSAPQAEVR